MSSNFFLFLLLFFSSSSVHSSTAALVQDPPLILKYHNGPLLKGKVTVNLLWYGQFTAAQRSIIADFILSLTSSKPTPPPPSVRSWWTTIHKYDGAANSTLLLGTQVLDPLYSLGKSLTESGLIALASKLAGSAAGPNPTNTINVVLTGESVSVTGFCSRCGTHSSVRARLVYAWVGDSETQCPGQCAWPFHQPIYGPQTAPLVAPNGDVGVDGMVINLATVLAGTVTNPYDTGYYQGPATAPLEAVTACLGIFGSGAYPGYPGKVLVEKGSGASYNAHGVSGRKYLLPAMWDPTTSKCATLV